jgi:hypothetical protein
MGAALAILRLLLLHTRAVEDLVSARQRGEQTAALLRTPVLQAGYGMPSEGDAFRTVFSSGGALPPWRAWDGPLSVTDWSGKAEGELRILFARASGVGTTAEFRPSPGAATILLNAFPEGAQGVGAGSAWSRPENWILFGAMRPSPVPLRLLPSSGSGARVQVDEPLLLVPENDQLYLLRAMRVHAEGGRLWTDECDGGGMQPRVEGVTDLRFRRQVTARSEDGRTRRDVVLTAFILTRGDETDPANLLRPCPAGWPLAYWDGIGPEQRRYRLVATLRTWRVRNWEP